MARPFLPGTPLSRPARHLCAARQLVGRGEGHMAQQAGAGLETVRGVLAVDADLGGQAGAQERRLRVSLGWAGRMGRMRGRMRGRLRVSLGWAGRGPSHRWEERWAAAGECSRVLSTRVRATGGRRKGDRELQQRAWAGASHSPVPSRSALPSRAPQCSSRARAPPPAPPAPPRGRPREPGWAAGRMGTGRAGVGVWHGAGARVTAWADPSPSTTLHT